MTQLGHLLNDSGFLQYTQKQCYSYIEPINIAKCPLHVRVQPTNARKEIHRPNAVCSMLHIIGIQKRWNLIMWHFNVIKRNLHVNIWVHCNYTDDLSRKNVYYEYIYRVEWCGIWRTILIYYNIYMYLYLWIYCYKKTETNDRRNTMTVIMITVMLMAVNSS